MTLTVAGDGPERAKVEAQAPPNVRFVGAQPREKVFELLHAADATLLSSDWESFSLVAAESLAVGTPVIAAAAGGVREVVEHERNGLLVPPAELADAIRRYFADPELQRAAPRAAAESVRRLAPEEIYPRYEAILEEAATMKRARPDRRPDAVLAAAEREPAQEVRRARRALRVPRARARLRRAGRLPPQPSGMRFYAELPARLATRTT